MHTDTPDTTDTSTVASVASVDAADAAVPLALSLVPPAWPTTVRVIGRDECRAAALSLAHAFAADALSRYLVSPTTGAAADDTAEHRWRLHVDVMTCLVAAVARNGLVTTTGADYDGVALWVGPGQNVDGWWTALRSGLWRLHYRLSPEGRRRYFAELAPLLQRTKQAVMGPADDSYYLLYLGTKPAARRRGCAQRLLEHMMARADAQGRPIYLESSSRAHNVYYGKFGFAWKRDIALVRGAAPIELSIMVRTPEKRL